LTEAGLFFTVSFRHTDTPEDNEAHITQELTRRLSAQGITLPTGPTMIPRDANGNNLPPRPIDDRRPWILARPANRRGSGSLQKYLYNTHADHASWFTVPTMQIESARGWPVQGYPHFFLLCMFCSVAYHLEDIHTLTPLHK